MTGPMLSRRQVLAFLALAEAPTPEMISFVATDSGTEVVQLALTTGAAVAAWATVFGRTMTSRPATNAAAIYHSMDPGGRWFGYLVSVTAHEELVHADPVQELYEETREQLQQLVDEQLVDEPAGGEFEDCCPDDPDDELLVDQVRAEVRSEAAR